MSEMRLATGSDLIETIFQTVWTSLAKDLKPREISPAGLEAALPRLLDLGDRWVSLDRATMAELKSAVDILGQEILDAAQNVKALVCLQAYRQLEGAGSDDPALPTRAPLDTG